MNVCEDYVDVIEQQKEERRKREEEIKQAQKERVANNFINFKEEFEKYIIKRKAKKRFKFKYSGVTWLHKEYFEHLVELINCYLKGMIYYISFTYFYGNTLHIHIKRIK